MQITLVRCTGSQGAYPVKDVINSLLQGGVSAVEVEVNLGWLIKGNYVTFDPEQMMIGRK